MGRNDNCDIYLHNDPTASVFGPELSARPQKILLHTMLNNRRRGIPETERLFQGAYYNEVYICGIFSFTSIPAGQILEELSSIFDPMDHGEKMLSNKGD